MGWLKDIVKGVGNAITGVVKGIGKVFGKIMEGVGKIFDSGWGKALLLAVSVFTFGAALIAGGSAFMGGMAAGEGFVGSFVAGGKAFVGSLLGTGGGGKETALAAGEGGTGAAAAGSAEAIAETAQAGSLAQRAITEGVPNAANAAGDLVSGGALTQAQGNLTGAIQGAGATAGVTGAGPTQALANAGGALAKPAAEGNWLSKAAKGAWEFAKSDAGQNLIGNTLEGYAQGERDQALIDSRERYDRMWQDPAQTQPITDLANNFGPDVPAVWNRDPLALANQRNRNYVPSVPYARAPSPAGG